MNPNQRLDNLEEAVRRLTRSLPAVRQEWILEPLNQPETTSMSYTSCGCGKSPCICFGEKEPTLSEPEKVGGLIGECWKCFRTFDGDKYDDCPNCQGIDKDLDKTLNNNYVGGEEIEEQHCYNCGKHLPVGYPVLCNGCVQRGKEEKAEPEEEWTECPTCGGMSKDLAGTDLGKGLKNAIEEPEEENSCKHLCGEAGGNGRNGIDPDKPLGGGWGGGENHIIKVKPTSSLGSSYTAGEEHTKVICRKCEGVYCKNCYNFCFNCGDNNPTLSEKIEAIDKWGNLYDLQCFAGYSGEFEIKRYTRNSLLEAIDAFYQDIK